MERISQCERADLQNWGVTFRASWRASALRGDHFTVISSSDTNFRFGTVLVEDANLAVVRLAGFHGTPHDDRASQNGGVDAGHLSRYAARPRKSAVDDDHRTSNVRVAP
jgi:hypothetical protein